MGRRRLQSGEISTTLADQDIYDINCLAHALGVDRSALLRQWTAEKLETIRRCSDIKKAEDRARLNNPNFLPFGTTAP